MEDPDKTPDELGRDLAIQGVLNGLVQLGPDRPSSLEIVEHATQWVVNELQHIEGTEPDAVMTAAKAFLAHTFMK